MNNLETLLHRPISFAMRLQLNITTYKYTNEEQVVIVPRLNKIILQPQILLSKCQHEGAWHIYRGYATALMIDTQPFRRHKTALVFVHFFMALYFKGTLQNW